MAEPMLFSPTLVPTELVNPNTSEIDLQDTKSLLATINREDQAVALAVRQAIPQIAPVVDAIAEVFRKGGRLLYFGAGTSGRLGVLDASECPPTFGVDPAMVHACIAGGDVALRNAVEGAEDSTELGVADAQACHLNGNDVVVGISASGGAAYVVAAMETARQAGVLKTACITCVAGSPLATAVDYPIVVSPGPEVIAGSTRLKAGTAQKLVLNMLSTAAMIRVGKTYGNLMVDVRPTNQKLRQRAVRLVAELGGVPTEGAIELLEAAAMQVKPAIVMARLGVSFQQASTLLATNGGVLRLTLQNAL